MTDLTPGELLELRRLILKEARRVGPGRRPEPPALTPEMIREREEADRLLQEAEKGQEPKGVA